MTEHKQVRIISDDGIGYNTRIIDTETNEDITAGLRVNSIHIKADEIIKAVMVAYPPKIDVVAEAEIHHVCPYCGREMPEEKPDPENS